MAGRLGKAKDVKRYHSLLLLTGVTVWDDKEGSMDAHFEQKFPAALRYPTNDYLKHASKNADVRIAPKP
ncbi:MAG: hypothetical protein V4454_14220 [Pseudomonadota bacterium]